MRSLQAEVAGYHIHSRTPEFEELLAWYVDVFGLEVRPRGSIQTITDPSGVYIELTEGYDAYQRPSIFS